MTDLLQGQYRQMMREAHGDSIRDPFLMELGNPFTGKVDISFADGAEMPGYVWIHARTSQTLAISGNITDGDDDKATLTRALCKPNKIPDDLKIYGLAVYVKEINGMLEVWDLGGIAALEYLYGLKNHNQRSVDVSQFDYGLLRPTAPPGAKIVSSPFRCTLDSVAYDIPTVQSVDLIDAYGGSLATGQARAVLVEIDPITRSHFYTTGTVFVDMSHSAAFPTYYPKNIDRGRFMLGYVKLYFGMEVINIHDIFPAQEVYSKDSLTGETAISELLLAGNDFVIAGNSLVSVTT